MLRWRAAIATPPPRAGDAQPLLRRLTLGARAASRSDIKPENLLVNKAGVLKLADFGVSDHIKEDGDDTISKSAGTPAFMAPECCEPGSFSGKQADLWAAAVSLYFMLHGPTRARPAPTPHASTQPAPSTHVERFSRTMKGSVARAHLAALTRAGRAGKCPIIESNVIRLFERIVKDPIEFDAALPPDVLDLLTRALDKDRAKRLSARPRPHSPRPSRRWKGDPSPSGE